MDKIKFSDLSGALKTIIVISWVIAGIYALTFFTLMFSP